MTATQTQKFNLEIYAPIPSNHLVVYAIYDLQNQIEVISTEDVISACFTFFPEKFSLHKYPQWPDSAMIGRRLHDCRTRRLIAAKTDHEVRLTFKGLRLAERTARALGMKVPVWKPKAKVVANVTPATKVKVPVVEAPKQEVKVTKPVSKPKTKPRKRVDEVKVAKMTKVVPVVEAPKQEVKVAKPVSKPKIKPKKRVDEVKVTEAVKPVPVAKPASGKPKVEKAKEKRVDEIKVTEVVKPASGKPKVEKAKEKRVAKAKVAEMAKPAPAKPKVEKAKEKRVAKAKVTEVVKPAPAKPKVEKAKEKRVAKTKVTEVAKPAPVKPKVEKAKEKRVAKVKVTEAVKPAPKAKTTVHRQLSLLPTVSAEEKARAGKFVRMMESSDAYRLYKKNGTNSNIGEFDFRSLLLCTMESSPETLARNVELFKGYAGIHNRQDLITFLTFCREKFAHLLVPEKKAVKKFK